LRYGIVNFGDLRPCERQKYQSNSFEIELTHVIFGGGMKSVVGGLPKVFNSVEQSAVEVKNH
jgi:hypothetical protein